MKLNDTDTNQFSLEGLIIQLILHPRHNKNVNLLYAVHRPLKSEVLVFSLSSVAIFSLINK